MTTGTGSTQAPLPDPGDPLDLARALIRRQSVTPAEGGALDLLQAVLEGLGFQSWRLRFDDPPGPPADNLYARLGEGRPNLCFAGHTDVVPPGDAADWRHGPFEAEVADGRLYGRGAVDMKGAVAAFVAAAARYTGEHGHPQGAISLLITGDEEGPAVNGTRKVLDWLRARGETLDACMVGEPTNPDRLGQAVKVGRRGSVNGTLTVRGRQGHTAYPHLADNPLNRLVRMLSAITGEPIDNGTDLFEPTTLALSSIDTGNTASNVIPAAATARFNIRHTDRQTVASLEAWLRRHCDAVGGLYELTLAVGAEAFVTPPGPLVETVAGAVERVTGVRPQLSTAGGTSDARFIKDVCPVVEFGLVGQTMHQVDENVALGDLETLTDVYWQILHDTFARAATGGSG